MTPGGVLGRTSGLALARLLGFPTGTGVQFGPNGQPVPFNYGTNVGGTYMTGGDGGSRSEEHTSELQSLMRISYAVICLKKKKAQTPPSLSSSTTRPTAPNM